MMKLFRDKKGVSPVVSAMIMILIVMMGMSAVLSFVVNYKKDFQLGSGSAVFESMTIEDVWFRNSSVAEVWVYNFGKVNMDITDVYVDSDAVVFTFVEPSDDLTIAVGGHCRIAVFSSAGKDFVMGDGYVFRIVTARGTSFEGIFTWFP
jgi:FlaG/FlaF family flagellin (archaellin)